ncbi:hypothetical protein [Sphingomonas mucosissima]|uniref:Uncharacterized protein n=1 Tax=Sphingomonas mucosissima TaxID=370959 RepID=A0A245ZST1_9SPHN|nr:hypothetical protein [Sphingomonas mucosissima]OWK32804.1 hypothetical protein SPMU_11460 [Sphingomonas mucosissima]
MKSILLAAAAMIAMPAVAQEQPAGTAGQTTPEMSTQGTATGNGMGTATDSAASTPATGGAGGMNSGGSMGSSNTMSSSGSMSASGDPAGGYQPNTSPMQGTPAPGATVRFQQAPDPNTAFPPPAPMQNYPVCKKGQYDKCIQRGGK